MPRNIAVKAKVTEIEKLTARMKNVFPDLEPKKYIQRDTFYRTKKHNQILKLRDFSAGEGDVSDLIYFEQLNQSGPTLNEYKRVEVKNSEIKNLREILAVTNGCIVQIMKKREFYMVGKIRVHIDHVEELGSFLKLEFTLEDNEPIPQAINEVQDLMLRLQVDSNLFIKGPYSELLLYQRAFIAGLI